MDLSDLRTREQLRRGFLARFGDGGALRSALAPGRVNLIGEHTDYNGGFVLPMAIARHTAVVFRPSSKPSLTIHSVHVASEKGEADDEFGLTRKDIPRQEDPRRRWANYVRGVAAALLKRGVKLKGGQLYIHADLPMGAGLSSSASLEVSTGLAFLALAGRKLAPQALALACQESEHTYVGIRCGIMDQTVASRARPGHALLLDCLDLSVRHVPIQLEGWCFAAFDTGVRHELASSEYNKRRAQCEHAAKLLGARTLRQVAIAQLLARGGRLSLDEHRRARHVLTEDLRVLAFAAALQKGDPRLLGRLLLEGHNSLAQDYEVSCKELDVLVKEAVAARDAHGPLCLGARMTGGGFGGAIVALIKAGAFEAVRAHLAAAYKQQRGRELATALVVEPAAGASVVPL